MVGPMAQSKLYRTRHDGTSLLYSKLEDFVDMNLMAFILPFKEI